MELLDQLIGRQIRRPSGLPGWLLGRLMATEHRALVDWMLASLAIRPTDRILDVGCGGGMTLRVLAERAPEGGVAGVDHSPTMVAQARRLNRAAIAGGRMSVTQGDVAALPFADGAFDLVCGVETLYFWPDPLRGLREVARVLRPLGRVALVMDISGEAADPGAARSVGERMGFRVYSGEEARAALREAGFVETSFKSEPARGKGWLSVYGTRPGAAPARAA